MAKSKYSRKKVQVKHLPVQAQKALMTGQTQKHAIVRAHIEDDFWGLATLAELWYTDKPMLWSIYYDGPSGSSELFGFYDASGAWEAWRKIAVEYSEFIKQEPAPNPVGPV